MSTNPKSINPIENEEIVPVDPPVYSSDNLSDDERELLDQDQADAKWEEEHWAEETFHEPPPPPRVDPLAALRAKYHAFKAGELSARLRAAGKQRFLITGMLPSQSIALMVGDSGIGKSPLLFQLGLCVAAGVPFFHHRTTPGLVLYFDHENNHREGKACLETIAEFLGFPPRITAGERTFLPDNFLYWNGHDKPKDWDDRRSVFDMIRELRPKLVIIDTMSKAFPWIEEKNSDANELINALMDVVSPIDASVILTHHFKKNTGVTDKKWASMTVQEKMSFSRGASSVEKGVDLRLVVEKPSNTQTIGHEEDWNRQADAPTTAFEISAYRRLVGDLWTIAVERVFREGEPIGHKQILGRKRLKNPKYQAIFEALPDPFRYKDVEDQFHAAGSNSGSSVQEFIKACKAAKKITPIADLPPKPGYKSTKGFAKVPDVMDAPEREVDAEPAPDDHR